MMKRSKKVQYVKEEACMLSVGVGSITAAYRLLTHGCMSIKHTSLSSQTSFYKMHCLLLAIPQVEHQRESAILSTH